MRNYVTTGKSKLPPGTVMHHLGVHKNKTMLPINVSSECHWLSVHPCAADALCGGRMMHVHGLHAHLHPVISMQPTAPAGLFMT